MRLSKKAHELDPRHTPLLEDHWSGYVWIRPKLRYLKYKGALVFTEDLGESIKSGAIRKAQARRVAGGAARDFKRVGYVYSSVDFIKILPCSEHTEQLRVEAIDILLLKIQEMKRIIRLERYRKQISDDYQIKPKRIVKNPGSRSSDVWVWGFENKSLGLSFPFVYSYVETREEEVERKSRRADTYMHDEQVRRASLKLPKSRNRPIVAPEKIYRFQKKTRVVGKSRREFCEYYGLGYQSMRALADGRIDMYKGWVRIDPPRKITLEEAMAIKQRLEEQKESDEV